MSAPLSLPSTRIDIGVCTFRRPELEQTLRSLAGLALPDGVSVRVIVADNDTSPSARPLVDGLRPSLPFDLLYVHCPVANISIARNACLQNSDGDFLAFIDDDIHPAGLGDDLSPGQRQMARALRRDVGPGLLWHFGGLRSRAAAHVRTSISGTSLDMSRQSASNSWSMRSKSGSSRRCSTTRQA